MNRHVQHVEEFAPEFQLVRRKRPRTSEGAFPMRGSPEKARRLLLPGLAELLAAQSLRKEWILDDYSGMSVDKQPESTEQYQEDVERIAVEDKTPWPSAKQYYDIFLTLRSELRVPVYDLGVDPRGVPLHPEFIYSHPVSCMYFLKCSRLLGKGSFGFPRKKKVVEEMTTAGKKPASKSGKKESSKDFEWRKMSFVTGLPKKQPVVRYVTATCYSRATDMAAKKKLYRMHAVMLADEAGTGDRGDYVLVHIRAGGSKRVGNRSSQSCDDNLQAPASPGMYGSANVKHNALCMERPVSPTSVAVPSYSSSTASTSPRNEKLLHAEFAVDRDEKSDHLVKLLTSQVESTPSMAHHALFSAPEDPTVDSARLALRNLIMKSCTSRDEMTKYVMGLQEELAALQNQNERVQ